MLFPQRIIIYGICDSTTGECLYVGQSVSPERRFAKHAKRFAYLKRRLIWCPLAVAETSKVAVAKESLWIARMKSEGEATQNKQSKAGLLGGIMYKGVELECVETGQRFNSYSHAGRSMGISACSIMRYHRKTGYADKFMAGDILLRAI